MVAFPLVGCAPGQAHRSSVVSDWKLEQSPPALAPSEPVSISANVNPTSTASVPSPTLSNEKWVPLARWCQSSGLSAPVLASGTPVPSYTLTTANGVFAFRPGSQIASWEGTEVRLGFAPLWVDRQPFLHGLDLRKTLIPLVYEKSPVTSNAFPVLVLDPGHGGEDAGARSAVESSWEKHFTLDWARRLQMLLATNGWQVFLTRSDDREMSLSNRVAFAAQHHADIFLSLHFNSVGTNTSQAGLETYCITPAGMPSSITRGYSDDIQAEFPNNAFDTQNLQLAVRLHRTLLAVNGHMDRGVRRARFLGVLRNQQRPAILIEGGYLSNPNEARLIAQPAYRQKLAEAVALGLAGVKSEIQNAIP